MFGLDLINAADILNLIENSCSNIKIGKTKHLLDYAKTSQARIELVDQVIIGSRGALYIESEY